MKITFRRFSILFAFIILLIVFLASLPFSFPVKADVGVRPILPGGSSISVEGETPIQMAAETVVMTVREATAADNAIVNLNPQSYGFNVNPVWYDAVADVKADFTMHNPTAETITMTVWFPMASALDTLKWNINPGETVPKIAKFSVSINGNPVFYFENLQPNPNGADKPMLPWATFTASFPSEADTNIQIKYTVPLSPAAKDYTVTLYYIFQTGAGWAGPIGSAEMIVNLPYPASAETLTGTNSLSLPYGGMGQVSGGLPAGVEVNGNQARWTWINFEPGPEDDFSIYLLKPRKWEDLKAARSTVQLLPNDGELWLKLAIQYHSLSCSFMSNYPLLFNSVYLSQAMDAYQKAETLLPDHPAPHIGLGMLTLSKYYKNLKNTPPDVIRYIQMELQTAKDLQSRNPDLMKGIPLSTDDLEFALSGYYYNDATATADRATLNSMFARDTQQATIEYLTRTIWASGKQTALACRTTPGADCSGKATVTATPTLTALPTITSTSSPLPTYTALPPTPTPIPEVAPPGNGLTMIFVSATGVLVLLAAGYLLLRRIQARNKGK